MLRKKNKLEDIDNCHLEGLKSSLLGVINFIMQNQVEKGIQILMKRVIDGVPNKNGIFTPKS